MIGLEQKIFSWRLVIILRRSQTLWVNSSLYLQIWNITVTPRPCWNVTIPGFSHTSLSMVTSPSWVVTSYHLADKCPLDISIVRCSLTCGRPSTDQPSVAAHCSQPSSAHITHWRLQRQPNTDGAAVSWALIGWRWPCAPLWLAQHANTLVIAGRPVLTPERPHSLARDLQNLARAFLMSWELRPSRNQSDKIVWSGQKCVWCMWPIIVHTWSQDVRQLTTHCGRVLSWWRFNFALTTLSN